MNDALFLGGLLLFLFVAWVYSGGPTHPISFAGPYITPITNVNTTQVGYGDGSALEKYTGKAGAVSTHSTTHPTTRVSVQFTGGGFGAATPENEYVAVHANAAAPVTISGWQLRSTSTGARVTIPQGLSNPDASGNRYAVPVTLQQNAEAVINTGNPGNTYSYMDSNGIWHVFLNERQTLWGTHGTMQLINTQENVVDQYAY